MPSLPSRLDVRYDDANVRLGDATCRPVIVGTASSGRSATNHRTTTSRWSGVSGTALHPVEVPGHLENASPRRALRVSDALPQSIAKGGRRCSCYTHGGTPPLTAPPGAPWQIDEPGPALV